MDLQPLFNFQNSISIRDNNVPIKQTSKLAILFKSKVINLAKPLLSDTNSRHFDRQLYLECIPLLVAIGIENNWDHVNLKKEYMNYHSLSLTSNIQLILEKDFHTYRDYKNIWCLFLAMGKKAGYSIENIQQHYLKLFKITPQGVLFRFDNEENFINNQKPKISSIM